MARISIEEVSRLWEELSEKSWDALYQLILDNLDEDSGEISSEDLLSVIEDAEDEAQPFPETPGELAEIINSRLAEII